MENKKNSRKYGGAEILINKNQIKVACAIVREATLCSNEISPNSYYAFSDTFQERMESALKSAKRIYNSKYYLRLAVSIVLVIAISIGSVFAFNTEARNRLGDWVRTIFSDQIAYSNEAEAFISNQISISIDDSEYRISLLIDLDSIKVFQLESSDKLVLLSIQTDNSQNNLLISDYDYQQTYVNNQPADFYKVNGGDGTNELFWLDESGCFLNLSGQLELDEMKCLAEKISIVE